MQIHLRPELERFVEEKVRQGRYPTTDAMVEEALALLYGRDHHASEFTPEHDAHIRERLVHAEDDMQHGRVTTVDDAGLHRLMADIMQRGRERVAELNNARR